MASYCVEKYEDDQGNEKKVCWRQDKHVHDASFITTIEKALGATYGNTWHVRVNSYQSNQSKCPENSVDYNDLDQP